MINVAVLGPSLGGALGVRLVFAENGPVSISIAVLVVGADELPDRRRFVLAAVLPRAEGDARWDEGRARRKLVPHRGWERSSVDSVSVDPRVRVAEDEGGFRSPRSGMNASCVGRSSLDLYFAYCRNCNKEKSAFNGKEMS